MIEARATTVEVAAGEGVRPDVTKIQPAFLFSCERSGSTLLRWLLDAHSEIASPGELRLGRLAFDLYVTLSRTVTVSEADSKKRVTATLREVRRVIDPIMERYARSRGKRIWCEKTPENLLFLEGLPNAYPDARYLCLYRNCLDVVASCLESSRDGFMPELAEYARRHPENHVEAMAESWAEKTATLLAFERRNSSLCHRVRYEDLVQSPKEELRAVFSHLGCAYEPAVLEGAFSKSHDAGGGDARIHSTRSVESDRVGGGRDVPVERLSSELRARIDTLSRQLGYDELS